MRLTWLKQEQKKLPEEVMLEAIMYGHNEIIKLIEFQEKIVAEIGKVKKEIALFELDQELFEEVKGICETKLYKLFKYKKNMLVKMPLLK